MKKYNVEVRRRTEEICFVTVEAENEEDAKDLAVEQAVEDESIEWDYNDNNCTEAYDVEEVKVKKKKR